MAKIKFKSGDIFKIPLPNDLGFAYAKCINLEEINSGARYPALIRVFNYRSIRAENGVEEIVKKELILSPLLIAGILPAISKAGSWVFITNTPVKNAETIIPHYKRPEPNEENAREWYYVIDADISKKVRSEYPKVKHLETIGAIGSELVGTKIAMALLQEEGKSIEDYFKLEEYFEKEFHRQVTTIPPYYKLPEYMKGKALE